MGLFRTDKEAREDGERVKNGCGGCLTIIVIVILVVAFFMRG